MILKDEHKAKLEEIKLRLNKRTPGSWQEGFRDGSGRLNKDENQGAYIIAYDGNSNSRYEVVVHGGDYEGMVTGVENPEDVNFILNAPTDIQFLLNRVESLELYHTHTEHKLKKFREALEKIWWRI